MQVSVYPLGQGVVDAFHAGDIVHAGRFQATQSTEMLEQAGAAARADAGDIFQPAGSARLLPLAAMAGDGEAVGLVAHLLHQLQGR